MTNTTNIKIEACWAHDRNTFFLIYLAVHTSCLALPCPKTGKLAQGAMAEFLEATPTSGKYVQ